MDRICELMKRAREFAVATIVSASEGSPRKSGTKIIVFSDGNAEFTIGGGLLEEETIKKCTEAIRKKKNEKIKIEFQEEKSGMLCGGEAEIFIEVYKMQEKTIIFGGGHIGMALSKLLDVLAMPYMVVDDRKEYADKERFPNACKVVVSDYGKVKQNISVQENSYCVIVTHGHKGDKDVLSTLINSPAKYIGMIGSKNKIQKVFGQLKGEGLNITDSRIYSPVGLDIGGETPEEIALAILAEIIKIKYNSTGKSLRDIK